MTCLLAVPWLAAAQDVERFDGAFRLEDGAVVHGGYMVEGGQGRWVYMDTEGLDRMGLFEGDGTSMRSVVPADGAVRIEFADDADALVWRQGDEALLGTRIRPHRSRAVRFPSEDGTVLEGRLLLPECDGPHPAVVSVHGSGPVDRHGGVFHTFFLQQGVAVLAYDKRGYTTDPDAWRAPDLARLSDDAAAAVGFAAGLPEIDADRVGLFGSSQGGWVVPAAARQARGTAYMILRAGAALSQAETNLHEVRQEARGAGLEGMDLDHAMALRREVYAVVMRGEPVTAADPVVAPYLHEDWYALAFGDGPVSELWFAGWWPYAQHNLAVASAPDVARFGGPVLWFLAERDEAVPLVPTRAALERAFDTSPGEDQQIVVIDDAPHSFMLTGEDGEPTYAPGFFDTMAEWMARRGFTDPHCWE